MAYNLAQVFIIGVLLVLVWAEAVEKAGVDYVEDTDRFPGWKGELPGKPTPDTMEVGLGELGEVRPALLFFEHPNCNLKIIQNTSCLTRFAVTALNICF